MFTGIIEIMAPIKERTETSLTLERSADFDGIAIGSSICVSGVCLSVIELTDDSMRFDVIPETFEKTNLGSLSSGDLVNLERALKADGRFDGHIVQGHVEGVGEVVKAGAELTIHVSSEIAKRCVPKGSITLDGVSLTIASAKNDEITVALIPHTLESTTLGLLKVGGKVNIETDILGRYAEKLLAS